MSLLKAVLGGIARNPQLIQSVVEDPRSVARLAGLSEDELCALAGIGNAVAGLLGRFRLNGGGTAGSVTVLRPRVNGANGGDQAVALTGVMSLLVVAGAVTALGAVSLVALSRRDADPTS